MNNQNQSNLKKNKIEYSDEDNLYNLPDEVFNDRIEEEDEDDEEGDDDVNGKDGSRRGIYILLKIMTNPVEGWKELKRSKFSVNDIAVTCFYPLIILASLSVFAKYIYSSFTPVSETIIEAITTFIALFLSYFTVILVAPIFLTTGINNIFSSIIGKQYIMINISTLALFDILYNFLPMLDPILVFLPLWTIYLICKGTKILRTPVGTTTRISVVASILIIATPFLWDWLFSEFLL